jgi:multidrug transporter EmrE-like cation transporter
MKYVAALVLALVLNASANLMMKVGVKPLAASGGLLKDGLAAGFASVAGSATLVAGLICFALNAAFYLYALQSPQLKISIAYPIMVGGGYALIALVARVHPSLQERLTWGQMLGVVLVMAGIVLIAMQSNVTTSATEPGALATDLHEGSAHA